MNETPSVFGTPREWALDLAIMTAVGVVFGLIGPFGTFNGGPVELRLAYWVANAWVGFIVLSMTVRLSIRASTRLDLPVWFALAMGVAIGALPISIEVAYFGAWMWPPNHGQVSPLFQQYGQVLVISEPLAFAYYFLADRGRRGTVWRAQPARSAPPAVVRGAAPGGYFLDRLPARLGPKDGGPLCAGPHSQGVRPGPDADEGRHRRIGRRRRNAGAPFLVGGQGSGGASGERRAQHILAPQQWAGCAGEPRIGGQASGGGVAGRRL